MRDQSYLLGQYWRIAIIIVIVFTFTKRFFFLQLTRQHYPRVPYHMITQRLHIYTRIFHDGTRSFPLQHCTRLRRSSFPSASCCDQVTERIGNLSFSSSQLCSLADPLFLGVVPKTVPRTSWRGWPRAASWVSVTRPNRPSAAQTFSMPSKAMCDTVVPRVSEGRISNIPLNITAFYVEMYLGIPINVWQNYDGIA